MKASRLSGLLIAILLTLIAMSVFAQEEEAPFPPPTLPLIPCDIEPATATVCDVIATTVEDIIGVWAIYHMGIPEYVRYNADGTWWMGHTPEASIEADPELPSGVWTIDENGIFTTSAPFLLEVIPELPEECLSGQYLARVIKFGETVVALNTALISDCFPPRFTDHAYTLLRAADE